MAKQIQIRADQQTDHSERRSRLYRAHAIVLRRTDLGETDRIVTLFTREFGKRRCVAKGARRPGSRSAGHLEPFAVVDVLLARGRNLDIISQIETVEPFVHLHQNERCIASAGLMAELTDRFSADDQQSSGMFELLEAGLGLLNQHEEPRRVLVVFEMGVLREAGFQPSLYSCVQCGRELDPVRNGFSYADGGVLCDDCHTGTGYSTQALTLNGLKFLRLVDRGEVSRALRIRVPDAVLREVDDLLASYTRHLLGQDSAARRVIRDLGLQYDDGSS